MRAIAFLLAMTLPLAACGTKGPLTLPPKPTPAAQPVPTPAPADASTGVAK